MRTFPEEVRGYMRFEDAAKGVAARYRTPAAHWYVRSKLALDPIGRALLDLGRMEGFGEVVDVGCGRGQFALLLREVGVACSALGVDWDAKKVAIANSAAAGDRCLSFRQGDVRSAELPACDTILLVDILHYLTPDEQDALLVRAASAARERVVVRDLDPEQGGASLMTEAWERVTTTLGYNRGARVAPRAIPEIARTLGAQGFEVDRVECSAKAMSNVLLVARRR